MEALEVRAPAMERWARRRKRARELGERYPFAAQLLEFYGALLDVQEPAFLAALDRRPPPERLAVYAADHLLPAVGDVTVARGPEPLRLARAGRYDAGGLDTLIAQWLAGEDQSPVDRYLARAAAGPLLEALGEAAGAACPGPRAPRTCPTCGGLPQVSYFEPSEEALVTGPRRLVCSRCSGTWGFERMTCGGCGEQAGSHLPIYVEETVFPHLRCDGCERCRRYLLTVDLRKDAEAVPLVDELAAVPLDLYVRERGMTKITPNALGL
jgi:formate dehydrogenase maturation protein FdhE